MSDVISTPPKQAVHLPELVVVLDKELSVGRGRMLLGNLGVVEIEELNDSRYLRIRIPDADPEVDIRQEVAKWRDVLLSTGAFRAVAPNIIGNALVPVNRSAGTRVPPGASEWHLQDSSEYGVHAETAWTVTQGQGSKVAVIDLGFDLSHSDLPTPTSQYDAVDFDPYEDTVRLWVSQSNPDRASGESGGEAQANLVSHYRYRHVYLPIGDFRGRDSVPQPFDHFHGTVISGFILAQGQGASGLSPDADYFPIRPTAVEHRMQQIDTNWDPSWERLDDEPPGYEPNWVDHRIVFLDEATEVAHNLAMDGSDLIAAFNWARNTADADVINMSLVLGEGFPAAYLVVLQTAVLDAMFEGRIVVAGSGNEGEGTSFAPANLTGVISVGALNSSGMVPDFSSSNGSLYPWIVAPGEGVYGILPTTYTYEEDNDVSQLDGVNFLGQEVFPPPLGGKHRYWFYQENTVGNGTFLDDYEDYDPQLHYSGGLDGTSIAAPIVSGICALVKSWLPLTGFNTMRIWLSATARPSQSPTRDGHGLVDAGGLLTSLKLPQISGQLMDPLLRQNEPEKPPTKMIRLTWEARDPVWELHNYRIYRSVDGGDNGFPGAEYALVGPYMTTYTDLEVYPGHTYAYEVYGWHNTVVDQGSNVDGGTLIQRSDSVTVHYPSNDPPPPPLESDAPAELTLSPNYPNPFNPSTQIKFGLPEATRVHIQILNSRGQQVRVLAEGQMPAGWHVVTWDGKNAQGIEVASGIYLYVLEASGRRILKKMTLIR